MNICTLKTLMGQFKWSLFNAGKNKFLEIQNGFPKNNIFGPSIVRETK